MATGFRTEDILLALSEADLLAREERSYLEVALPEWRDRLVTLQAEACPRTYFPVLCVLLVARSLSPSVNVLKIQKRDAEDGYSASSIGTRLIPFATQQGIDLRSTSTQVMNNQPFTFKQLITSDLTDHPAYPKFFAAAQAVQELDTREALRVLALAFCLGRELRRRAQPLALVDTTHGGYDFLLSVSSEVSAVVKSNPDNGRAGQALGASLFDVLYGPDQVLMKKVHDPSFSSPGDFMAGKPKPWVAGESKQKTVNTGTVAAFGEACHEAGIQRAVYLALANEAYPENLSLAALDKRFRRRVQLRVFVSPLQAIDALLLHAPGSPGDQAAALVQRMATRMYEIGCSQAATDAFRTAMKPLGFE